MGKQYKTVKLSSKRQITIPKSFHVLREGDTAQLTIEDNKVILEPIKNDKDLFDAFTLAGEEDSDVEIFLEAQKEVLD